MLRGVVDYLLLWFLCKAHQARRAYATHNNYFKWGVLGCRGVGAIIQSAGMVSSLQPVRHSQICTIIPSTSKRYEGGGRLLD